MTTEEKELYKVARRNLELMKECKEILDDINEINELLESNVEKRKCQEGRE